MDTLCIILITFIWVNYKGYISLCHEFVKPVVQTAREQSMKKTTLHNSTSSTISGPDSSFWSPFVSPRNSSPDHSSTTELVLSFRCQTNGFSTLNRGAYFMIPVSVTYQVNGQPSMLTWVAFYMSHWCWYHYLFRAQTILAVIGRALWYSIGRQNTITTKYAECPVISRPHLMVSKWALMPFIQCLSLTRTAGRLWWLYGLQWILSRRKPQVALFTCRHHPNPAWNIFQGSCDGPESDGRQLSRFIQTTDTVTSKERRPQIIVDFLLYSTHQQIPCHKDHTMSFWFWPAWLTHDTSSSCSTWQMKSEGPWFEGDGSA